MNNQDGKSAALILLEEQTALLKKIFTYLSNQGSELSSDKDPARAPKNFEIPNLISIENFAKEIGCPSYLAGNFYYDKQAIGWRHNGCPIVDWQALFVAYVRHHDQRMERDSGGGSYTQMTTVTRDELLRAHWIKQNRDVWHAAGCPDDISDLMNPKSGE